MIYGDKESSGRAFGQMRADAARPQTLTAVNGMTGWYVELPSGLSMIQPKEILF